MYHKIPYWEERIGELKDRVTATQVLEQQEVIAWCAECVSVFAFLGVPSEIIRGFMKMFEFDPTNERGPWQTLRSQWLNPSRQNDRINGFFYPRIAFSVANILLNKLEEQERIVPQSLITFLQSKQQYGHLATSFDSLQKAYEASDIEMMLSSGTALLQSVLELQLTVSQVGKRRGAGGGLKGQLQFLADNKNDTTLADFGIDRELVEIFHNFRYLRNKISQHKTRALPKPPLAVGFGFASLLVIFIDAVIARGILIK